EHSGFSPTEPTRAAVAGLDPDPFPFPAAAPEPRGRAQQVIDMPAHHDVTARCGDFRHKRRDRIAGIDRISGLRGFRAELCSDTLCGVDRPLLVAVQD